MPPEIIQATTAVKRTLALLFSWAALCANPAQAALTDIATSPLVTASSTAVLPNIMFILDDSGSMAWSYMPDTVQNFAGSLAGGFKYGYRSSQCNGVYYNPAITYTPPVDANGVSYPNSSFLLAPTDGYNLLSSRVSLLLLFQAYDNTTSNGAGADTAQPAYYYSYTGTQTAKSYYDTSSTFYKECNAVIGATPGKNVFTKVTVSATSGPGGTDERQNFANWFSYYRTRILTMKTATGKAFQPIDSRYRVGFMTINTPANNTGHNFLDIDTFNSSQKAAWYAKLYGVDPGGGTPLRAALSKAGRIFAGELGTDPVQYSCQQNFTILSSDGFWNGAAGYREDGSTAIGNQDNNLTAAPRPFYDGNLAGASDTLADVAMYYYNHDLRSTGSIGALGTDVSENNVPTTARDTATWQHMTTFTFGLGAYGRMTFSSSYETDTSGDFYNVKAGTVNACSWVTTSPPRICNWPVPAADQPDNIDDLWHAAVNGRGIYYSATSASDLATGLSRALAGVSARSGSTAAATTSNPNVTSGDNYVFSSSYTTGDWTGELIRQQLDLTTGALSPTTDWSARSLLDVKVAPSSDTRTIYTFDPTGANKLKAFAYSGLSATQQLFFGSDNASILSQFPLLSAALQLLVPGDNWVNFSRGRTGNEGLLYRSRAHTLGDIVSAETAYVKVPMFDYTDPGYAAYKAANLARQNIVYAAANDGMLHAFNATTGVEQWAYMPSLVMPNVFRLADSNYANLHRFYVDGTPTVGDAYFGGSWKTVLVGGLNGGGRGYYALDITDPANPKGLWEFTYDTGAGTGYTSDADLGYTFGNPVITKKKNGTWVVLVTSGYNNVSPGTGRGYLYVLDAGSGSIISKIDTGQGSTTTPSGLARINAWVSNTMIDNTALQVYGGDLLGNLWRFDINGDVGAAGMDAQLLATFRGPTGNIQPITSKPEVGLVNTSTVVFVGTGRYLGASDLTDTSQQSFYAIKDPLDATSWGNVRASGNIVQQTLTNNTDPVTGSIIRTGTINSVNFATQIGWFIDLPDNSERSTTDPSLALGTLVFSTNVPSSSACTVGGYSWLHFLDYRTGRPLLTATAVGGGVGGGGAGGTGTGIAGQRLGNALATRPVLLRLPNNTIVSLTKLSDTAINVSNVPVGSSVPGLRRIFWRELINE